MEDKRGQTIFLSVVGVATLLVAIVGATFAYFSITVTESGVESVLVRTATLTSITYTDGDQINDEEIYPGGYITKPFVITAAAAAGDTSTAIPTDYSIGFQLAEAGSNTLLTALSTENTALLADVTHQLLPLGTTFGSVTTSDNNNTVYGDAAHKSRDAVDTTDNNLYATLTSSALITNVDQLGTTIPVGTGRIYPGVVHTYAYRIMFAEKGAEQNYAQGKVLNGTLRVTASSAANYTTGSDGSGSQIYN